MITLNQRSNQQFGVLCFAVCLESTVSLVFLQKLSTMSLTPRTWFVWSLAPLWESGTCSKRLVWSSSVHHDPSLLPVRRIYLILMNWEWSSWLLAKTAVAVTQWYTAYFESLALLACWTLYCPLKAVENWVVVFVARQHWIANNLFGLAFALNGVELLHLNNVSTGCILLGGLFVYDVFWVSWCAFCNHVSITSRQITMYEDVVLLNSECW